jgi:hypothetical protein
MGRALVICVSAAIVALLAGLYWHSPTRQASIGAVTLSFEGFGASKNDTQALFLISNGGPFTLHCGVGTEVKDAGEWQDPPEGRSFDFASVPLLPPRTATTINIARPGGTGVWRAVVQAERYYENTDAGRRKRDFDWYVRKKAFLDTSRSEEISR